MDKNEYREEMEELLDGLDDLMSDLEDLRDDLQDALDETGDQTVAADIRRMDAALTLLAQAAVQLEQGA